VNCGRDTGRFRLQGLGPANLETFDGGHRVERHVLRFEGGNPVPVLGKDAAEGGSQQRFADMRRRAQDHDGASGYGFISLEFQFAS